MYQNVPFGYYVPNKLDMPLAVPQMVLTPLHRIQS
jgi:hypothetical protein